MYILKITEYVDGHIKTIFETCKNNDELIEVKKEYTKMYRRMKFTSYSYDIYKHV